MIKQTRIPNELMDCLAHSIFMGTQLSGNQGTEIYVSARKWNFKMDALRKSRLLTIEDAVELWAVACESIEYVLTHNFGTRATKTELPETYKLALYGEELLSFLEDAAVPNA